MTPAIWKSIGALIALAALVYGLYALYRAIDSNGYSRGKSETKAAYAERDNVALLAANNRIKELEDEARKREQEGSRRIAAVASGYEKQIEDQRDRESSALADLRAGRIILRDPGSDRATICTGGEGASSTASSGRRDDSKEAELSGTAAQFLLGLAAEADRVATQLAACQAVVLEDRRIVDGE